jgi:hypothetical protein
MPLSYSWSLLAHICSLPVTQQGLVSVIMRLGWMGGQGEDSQGEAGMGPLMRKPWSALQRGSVQKPPGASCTAGLHPECLSP